MNKKHTREQKEEQNFINTNECSSLSLTPFEEWQREFDLGIKKLNQWSGKKLEGLSDWSEKDLEEYLTKKGAVAQISHIKNVRKT